MSKTSIKIVIVAAVFFGVIYYCSTRAAMNAARHPEQYVAAVPLTSVSIAPSPAAAPPSLPAEVVVTASLMTTHKEILDECVDITIRSTPREDSGTSAAAKVAGVVDAMMKGRKNAVRLQKSCTEQFAGRTVLASCTVDRKLQEGEAQLLLLSRYYNVDTLETDARMKDCIKLKGDWQELPKNSHEFTRARLEGAMKDAKKAIEETQP